LPFKAENEPTGFFNQRPPRRHLLEFFRTNNERMIPRAFESSNRISSSEIPGPFAKGALYGVRFIAQEVLQAGLVLPAAGLLPLTIWMPLAKHLPEWFI
jgi:hypothetical protein